MNVTFRADASIEIGTGHIMRCLTLADALKEQGAHCHFICREHEGNLIELIKEKGHTVTALPIKSGAEGNASFEAQLAHSHWLGTTQKEDAEQTLSALKAHQTKSDATTQLTDWLVVDHYALDAQWERALKPYTKKIMVIDDLADRLHECDLLLDQNLGKTPADYYELAPEHCALLLGPQYALLQPQYAELHPRTPPRQGPIKNILIYFGGSDQNDLTGMAVRALLELKQPDLQINVVMGSSYSHKANLKELAKTYSNLLLHQNLPSLALLMLKADLSIGAGGSTSWERCCLGLPSMVITLAKNQEPIADALMQQGLAIWLGVEQNISKSKIKSSLTEILNQQEKIVDWSKRCLSITQGLGASNIASYMLLNKQTPLRARLARLTDKNLLLEWANDHVTRVNSFNTNSITSEQHRSWYYQKLRSPDTCKLYILESELNSLPIGQVRFDWLTDKQAWQINYSICAAARGKGLGTKLLEKALEEMNKTTGSFQALGEVKHQNDASKKIFENLNFQKNNAQDKIIYSKTIG